MANIAKWLLEMENLYGEAIEAIVVGVHDIREWTNDDKPRGDENVVLGRAPGLKKLDEEYDNGYGDADCYPMYAWTASRVFFINKYDGATGIVYIPRNPCACEPGFNGGNPALDSLLLSKLGGNPGDGDG